MDLLREYVVFDTETTGTPPGARLVEIGALKVRGRNVLERFDSLVFPECPIPEEVVGIHGITDADVLSAPTAAEVVPDFLEWVGRRPLVAHNAPFDASMLASECQRLGLPVPENPVLCTLRASRGLLRRRSHSLQSLVRDLGIPAEEHHRASADAEQAMRLLWYLREAAGASFRSSVLGKAPPLSSFVPEPPRLPSSKQVLAEAADRQEAVDLRYALPGGRVVPMRVSPRFFYLRRQRILMEALCHLDLHYKTYRLERIASAHFSHDAPPVGVRRRLHPGG